MDSFTWRSESDDPVPSKLTPVDDRLRADAAMSRVRRGESLLYQGDFHNAKQLLTAMGRRLPKRPEVRSPLQAFRAERKTRQLEHKTLSRVVVSLDRDYRLGLARAPDVAEACRWVWGEPEQDQTLVPLKALLGMLGAAEWRRKGLAVPGLEGALTPHYGVFLPTRPDYVELLLSIPSAEGKRVFDVGTGSGVLSFLLLQRGATEAIGTDCDSRAVACATENAQRLGLTTRFLALERDLFPDGQADLVVSNPPWIPEAPKNRVDRAVFDEDNRFLRRFLQGLRDHLAPEGRGLLLLSNLAVLLGLRSTTWLDEQLAAGGLRVEWVRANKARHGRAADTSELLHAARSREVTSLFCLAPA